MKKLILAMIPFALFGCHHNNNIKPLRKCNTLAQKRTLKCDTTSFLLHDPACDLPDCPPLPPCGKD